ncbi:hypothetical protein LTR86_007292 [Recurvomyces mirabilis]|nr:hypothetical protein LTR86_007292 [Recurvomyces mirabilis]
MPSGLHNPMLAMHGRASPDPGRLADETTKRVTSPDKNKDDSNVNHTGDTGEQGSNSFGLSWLKGLWSNPLVQSFAQSAGEDIMAAGQQGKMPDKEQLLKTIEQKGPDGPQKQQLMQAVKSNQKKIPNQEQLMKTLNDKGLGDAERQQLMKTVNNRGLDTEQKDQLMAQLKDKTTGNPQADQLMQALAAQQQANGLLQKALSLKDMALKCLNPVERQRLIQEAYDKELQANGQSKWAKRLTSGPWQGGMGGAGIGGGVGMGIGTVVGTLVGSVAALPTTAIGGLVGVGVGGIHGPFVKLNQQKAKEVAEKMKKEGKSEEEIAEAIKAEAGEGLADGAMADANGDEGGHPDTGSTHTGSSRQHSGGKSAAAHDPNQPRKKPRKLEVRSGTKKPSKSASSGNENRP